MNLPIIAFRELPLNGGAPLVRKADSAEWLGPQNVDESLSDFARVQASLLQHFNRTFAQFNVTML
jgi:hypothetical protein